MSADVMLRWLMFFLCEELGLRPHEPLEGSENPWMSTLALDLPVWDVLLDGSF